MLAPGPNLHHIEKKRKRKQPYIDSITAVISPPQRARCIQDSAERCEPGSTEGLRALTLGMRFACSSFATSDTRHRERMEPKQG
eukprot:9477259-Pyramimonas_sp.AAC.1